MSTRSSVSFNLKPCIKNIDVTPGNKRSKNYPKSKSSLKNSAESKLEVPQSDQNCPCGFANSPKLHVRSNQQTWLQCDTCQQWFHIECLAISKKHYNKLYAGEHQSFNCIPCQCKLQFDELKSGFISQLDSLCLDSPLHGHFDDALNAIFASNNKTDSSSTNHVTGAESSDPPSADQYSPVTASPVSPNLSSHHTKKRLDFSPENPIPFPIDIDTPVSEVLHEPLTTQVTDNTENIVIIDDIDDPSKFVNSPDILREIKKHKPSISCSHVHILKGGGIAIHCRTTLDKEEALKPWPDSAFNSRKIYPHTPVGARKNNSPSKIVVRNIPAYITDQQLSEEFTHITGQDCHVHRFYNRRTNSPMPIAAVKFSNLPADLLSDIISRGLTLANKVLPCEPFRNFRIYRCYNCQTYGHVAKSCNKLSRCLTCGDTYKDTHDCNGNCFCTNCKSDTHTADSKHCPAYTKIYKSILSRLSTCFHHEMSPGKHTLC